MRPSDRSSSSDRSNRLVGHAPPSGPWTCPAAGAPCLSASGHGQQAAGQPAGMPGSPAASRQPAVSRAQSSFMPSRLTPQHWLNPVCNAVLAVVRHYLPCQQGQQVRTTWQRLGPCAPASDCGEGSQGGTRAPAPATRSSGGAGCWARGAARPASRRNAAAAGRL
jgi:hypothetical protein